MPTLDDRQEAAPVAARMAERAVEQRRLEDAAVVARRLAHDFGNILTGILGFSELALKQVPPDSPVFRFMEEVRRAAEEGAQLTHLLRIFGCRRAVSSQTGSLAVAAAAEADRLRAALRPEIQVRVSVPVNLPPVTVSDELLRMVLGQLLENAREALPGPGVIGLSARAAQLSDSECVDLLGSIEPGPCVEVCVTDTGPGLSPEARRQLFAQPFFSTKPRHRGLGLAVVFGVLRAHRGGFRLDAAPGGGTCVRLYLPPAVGSSRPSPPSVGGGAGEKVLVVDDDPAVLQMVGTTLRNAGYRVQTLSCPIEALDAYAAEPFQLVLSDLLMPRMNGFDLARQLLHRDASANVLFMSGDAAPEPAETPGAPGQFDLLFKPFRPEALLRAVRTALDRAACPVPAGSDGPREETVVPPSS
jgi:CheY-like chemotaxis protein